MKPQSSSVWTVSPQTVLATALATALSRKSTNTSLVLVISIKVEDMMMYLLFLLASYPVATTVDTRYASAYATTREETGPAKIVNCDLYFCVMFCVI